MKLVKIQIKWYLLESDMFETFKMAFKNMSL